MTPNTRSTAPFPPEPQYVPPSGSQLTAASRRSFFSRPTPGGPALRAPESGIAEPSKGVDRTGTDGGGE